MPIYEYRCANGHEFEVFQNMSEDPVSSCSECGEPVERVFHPVAVHFKGSGFYTTDYARGKAKPAGADGAGDSDGGADKSDSATSDSTKSESGKGSGKPDSAKKDSGGEKAKAASSD